MTWDDTRPTRWHERGWMTKYLPCTVSTVFAVWRVTAKLPEFVFFQNFANARLPLTIDLSLWFFFHSLSQELSPFHLKEAVCSLSLAYLDPQSHYSCTLLSIMLRKTPEGGAPALVQHFNPLHLEAQCSYYFPFTSTGLLTLSILLPYETWLLFPYCCLFHLQFFVLCIQDPRNLS